MSDGKRQEFAERVTFKLPQEDNDAANT